jgi:hypothetical protein
MKAFALLLLCLTTTFFYAHGQDCKYTFDKKDDFTGEYTRSIVNRIDNQYFTWTSTKKGDKYFIDIAYYYNGEIHEPMTTSDSLQIKLANGTILTLLPVRDVQPVTKSILSSSRSYSYSTPGPTRTTTKTTALSCYTPTFAVDRNVFEELSRSTMTTMRIHIDKAYDIDFTKRKHYLKGCRRLMSDAKCIL